MASLLSPGVISREIDLTTVTPAVASTEGGISMHAQWGPLEKLVLITDELDLVDVFGKPNNDNASNWFTAKNFLSYSGALYVSRAMDTQSALNSTNGNAGKLIKNLDHFEEQVYSDGEWAAKYAGKIGDSLKVSLADSSTFDSWTYKSLFSEKPDLDGLHIVVVDEDGLFSGVKGTVLEKFEFLSKFSDGKSEDGSSTYYQKVINESSEYLYNLGHYSEMTGWGGSVNDYLSFDEVSGLASHQNDSNGVTQMHKIMLSHLPDGSDPTAPLTYETYTLDLGQISLQTYKLTLALDPAVLYAADDLYTFPTSGDVALVAGGSTDGIDHDTIIDTEVKTPAKWNGQNFAVGEQVTHLDPTDTGSGGTVYSWDNTTGEIVLIDFFGLFPNNDQNFMDVLQSAGGAEAEISFFHAPTTELIQFQNTNFTVGQNVSQTVNGVTVTGEVTGWDETTGKLIVLSEDAFVSNNDLNDGGTIQKLYPVNAVAMDTNPVEDSVNVNTSHSLQHGHDGAIAEANRVSALSLFEDDELVDISFLLAGEVKDSSVINEIFRIVTLRQDCLGVISPKKSDCVNAIDPAGLVKTFREGLNVGGLKDLKGSFMVMDDNWKYQYDKYNDVNRWVPCNGDTGGLMAETDLERAAWFSPGGRSLKNVIKLAWKSKKAERDVLYPLGINSVTTFPGEGAILYGDRTMLKRPSAFDRINVRRLFIILRKTISRTARAFLFEQNTEFTRERFKSTVIPFLEEVQGRQGITDFLVVCDDTNNTGQVIDQNRFIGDIYIKPTRSINFIELNFVAVRTDVEFSEVVGSV